MKTLNSVKLLVIASSIFLSSHTFALILAQANENPMYPAINEEDSMASADMISGSPDIIDPIENANNTEQAMPQQKIADNTTTSSPSITPADNANTDIKQTSDATGQSDVKQNIPDTATTQAEKSPNPAAEGNTTLSSTATPESQAEPNKPVQLDLSTVEPKDIASQPVPVTPITDTDIIANIRTTMSTNDYVSKVKVKITSNEGYVRLSGRVRTPSEANALIMIAEATDGVKDVNVSGLTLEKNAHLSRDAVITSKIKGIYIREKVSSNDNANPIRVITTNGVVSLMGSVSSEEEVLRAVSLATKIPGVGKVNSRLMIGSVNEQVVKS